jgi:hypothetical protein
MPKATIQYPTTDAGYGSEVAVHWSKEQSHVQVSITSFPFGVVAIGNALDAEGHPVVEPAPSIDAQKVADADTGVAPDNPYARDRAEAEETSKSLYSEPMTRHQLNEMIRVLRRARDAAFGADA